MLTYEQWSQIAECIFKEPFLDQLREENKCDLVKEIEQCYQYLQKHDNAQLRADSNQTDLAEMLGIDLQALSAQEGVNVPRFIAEKCLKRLHDNITVSDDDDDDDEFLRTLSTTLSGVDDVTSAKNTGGHNTPARNHQRQPITKAIRTTINDFLLPTNKFKPTETLKTVKGWLTKTRIVHLHGMSGSGKSQMARAICKDYDEHEEFFFVSHTQCEENRSTVVPKCKKLLEALTEWQKNIISEEERRKIEADMDQSNSKSFVRFLAEIGFNFLFVVEDVASDVEKAFLRSLIESACTKMRILVVTRKEDDLYLKSEMTEDYVPVKVEGFEEEVAVKYLEEGMEATLKVGVRELAVELAYSPLRLLLAKNYCKNYNVSYERYLKNLGHKDIVEKEKRMLKDHPEHGKHTYEVILKILEPQDESDVDAQRRFKVVKMMSFLADAEIPDFLPGAFYREIEFLDAEEERRQVEYLFHTLEKDCDMNIRYHVANPHQYGLQRAWIHNDIMCAVRNSMNETEKSCIVRAVLGAVVGLIGKENRERKINIKLIDMMHHMITITKHTETLLADDVVLDAHEQGEVVQDKYQLLLLLSRLHEILGFSATQVDGSALDGSFEKSLDYLWKVSCFSTSSSQNFFLKLFTIGDNSEYLETLIKYEEGKDPRQTAKKIYTQLCKSASKISADMIETTCRKFFPITIDLLKGMKSKVPEQEWIEMEKTLKEIGVLTTAQIEILKRNGALLNSEILQKLYLPECMISILHSRGRLALYSKQRVSAQNKKRYDWYTAVGIELAKLSSDDIKIKSLFEYMLQANNRLPRLLHILSDTENDEEFVAVFKRILKLAVTCKDVEGDFYEHGVFKPVSGTPFTIMNALKYLVKLHTKVHKRPQVLRYLAIPDATRYCEELYEMAKKNNQFAAASNCMIHVGKYYAAIEEFDKAFEAFENGFNFKGSGNNYQIQKNTNIYTWALHNYARAILASAGKVNQQQTIDRVAWLKNKYPKNLEVSADWRKEMNEIMAGVKSLFKAKAN